MDHMYIVGLAVGAFMGWLNTWSYYSRKIHKMRMKELGK